MARRMRVRERGGRQILNGAVHLHLKSGQTFMLFALARRTCTLSHLDGHLVGYLEHRSGHDTT
jgi:hypothetical protein